MTRPGLPIRTHPSPMIPIPLDVTPTWLAFHGLIDGDTYLDLCREPRRSWDPKGAPAQKKKRSVK